LTLDSELEQLQQRELQELPALGPLELELASQEA
jgi:hypothetical protein